MSGVSIQATGISELNITRLGMIMLKRGRSRKGAAPLLLFSRAVRYLSVIYFNYRHTARKDDMMACISATIGAMINKRLTYQELTK